MGETRCLVCTQRPCWGHLGARSTWWRLTELDVWLGKRLWLGWATLQGQVRVAPYHAVTGSGVLGGSASSKAALSTQA